MAGTLKLILINEVRNITPTPSLMGSLRFFLSVSSFLDVAGSDTSDSPWSAFDPMPSQVGV